MDPEILSIRLSEEAKRWDEMVDRLAEYLAGQLDSKKRTRTEKIAQRLMEVQIKEAEKDEQIEEKRSEDIENEDEGQVDETDHIDQHGI